MNLRGAMELFLQERGYSGLRFGVGEEGSCSCGLDGLGLMTCDLPSHRCKLGFRGPSQILPGRLTTYLTREEAAKAKKV